MEVLIISLSPTNQLNVKASPYGHESFVRSEATTWANIITVGSRSSKLRFCGIFAYSNYDLAYYVLIGTKIR